VQRAINRQTAARYGLEIVESIELSDVSGSSVLLAPEIQRMITRMADPSIHGIVCREFSRLMRPESFADYALLGVFQDTNTILFLPEGPIDFGSADGRLMGGLKALIDGNERIELVKKMWSAKEHRRRTGGFAQNQNCLPFGVTFSDGRWSYTPDAERIREAFRLFLSGEISYATIARKVGVLANSLPWMLKNPIYTGWRVIDKRCDPTPGGKMTKPDGRQGKRRKIKRLPEDVIRVKVIAEGLISESEFARAQQIIEVKKLGHWRLKNIPRRFTYHGFIKCECGARVYTRVRGNDYYVCSRGCGGHYMRKDRLEPRLDRLFAAELTSLEFLEGVYASTKKSQPQVNVAGLKKQLMALEAKRQRILDGFFEGIIDVSERDLRLGTIVREQQTITRLLAQNQNGVYGSFSPIALAEMFSPFVEFDLLNRDRKRRLLCTLTPSIICKNYEISGVTMHVRMEEPTHWLH